LFSLKGFKAMNADPPHEPEKHQSHGQPLNRKDDNDNDEELTDDAISELTLAGIPGDAPFDLEKFLRKLMKL
jgi:hypothetical protein